MAIKTFRYKAIAFRQQPKAPIQVTFVAPSGEILEWAGIPRKSDEFLTGYQRFQDRNRIDRELVPFFGNPENCSPTAAILALRSASPIGGCVLADSDLREGDIVETEVVITVDEERLSSDEIFEIALVDVERRLEHDSDETRAEPGDEDEIQDLEDADGSDEEDDDSGSEAPVHLGTVTLARLAEMLRDEKKWLIPAFRKAIQDFVKPATVIDGQHRLAAAARIGVSGLPFMVCALFGSSWSEQVFQFTVVNLKPKRIPPALITSIAALSLTRGEQRGLKRRLSDAGVKMREVEIMSLVAYDELSPFESLVNMAVASPEVNRSLLGYAGVKRFSSEWYRCARASLINLAKGATGHANRNRARATWQSGGLWFRFFSAFWNAVRESVGDDLWIKKDSNNLFIASNLGALQESFLRSFDRYPVRTWSVDPLLEPEERERLLSDLLSSSVRELMQYFPKDLWMTEWSADYRQTATSSRRAALATRFDEFITEGSGSGTGYWKGWKGSKIITGEQK